jgi:hypothetical protein
MNIDRSHLGEAVAHGIVSEQQSAALWQFFSTCTQDEPSFRATHILYYLGGMIAIGAMTLFMNLGWERFGGWGLFAIAFAYCACGLLLTHRFIGRGYPVPAGITSAFAVALIPLAVYGLQVALAYWPAGSGVYRDYHRIVDWRWMVMELATLLGGTLLLWRYRLPFMVMPIAVTLWYMSMDFTPLLFGDGNGYWAHRKLVSLVFGLAMIVFAVALDLRARRSKDYAFWLYIFGVIAFWGSLTAMDSSSEWGKFLYCCINLAMIAMGAILSRRVFAVFGALGLAGYLFHLADKVFKDSMLFPVALTALGLGVVGLGILWQRNEHKIASTLRSVLPDAMRSLLDRND